MHTKRIISFITIAVFVTTILSFIPVSAAEADLSAEKAMLMMAAGEMPPVSAVTEESVKIKRDKAIEIAKTMLVNASDFDAANAGLNPGYGVTGAFWSINFFGKSNPSMNVNVNVDAESGGVTGYNMWNGVYGQQNYIAKFTRKEALVFADDFMKNKIKYDVGEYELQPEDPYANTYRMGGVKETFVYNFTYIKKLNGILLPADTVYICVDGTNGKVTSFNRNTPVIDLNKLPSAASAIPHDRAFEKYKQSVNLSLQYITQYPDSPYGYSKPKILLAYVPAYYTEFLDAEKGVLIGYDGLPAVPGDTDQFAGEPLQLDPDAILPPAAAKTESEARVIAEGYKNKVEELLGIKFNDVNTVQQINPLNDSWNFNWNKSGGSANYNFNISINMTTGRLSSLNFNQYDIMSERMMVAGQKLPEIKEKISWSEGRKTALKTLKQLVPTQYGFYADQNLKEPEMSADIKKTMQGYSYNFTRVVNGILFRDNTIGLTVDRETGKVSNFYMNWTDGEFPKADAIVTREAAVSKYFEGMEGRLQYFLKTSYDQTSRMSKTDPVPMLVYSFTRKGFAYSGGMYVDALTGKLLDYGGREIRSPASATESQLADNWAKRSVELLVAQGILKNPYIDYDHELTRAETVKMLALAKGNINYYNYSQTKAQTFTDVPADSEYYAYVENAVNQGIIAKGTEFRGDEKITKEEFAVLLVNMAGYSELAKKTSVFRTDGLNAADPANAGYVAVCSALDFLPVKPGEAFDGNGKLTLAEAAFALYKALSYIR